MMRKDGELNEETPEESDQLLTASSFSLVLKCFPLSIDDCCEKKEEEDPSGRLVITN